MKHYLVTPWNTDKLDVDWLEERHTLFEKFCLPSVQSQTNKNFEWVIIADDRTPKRFRKRLRKYPATIVYAHYADDKWKIRTHTHPIQVAANLEVALAKPLRDYIGVQDTDYVITSRLDSDDAISIDHIEVIQREVKVNRAKGCFWLNITRGYKYCRGYVYPINRPKNPYISFVEPPADVKTVYQVSHGCMHMTDHPVVLVRFETKATWMQVIHGGNLLNKLMRTGGKAPFSTISKRFKINE